MSITGCRPAFEVTLTMPLYTPAASPSGSARTVSDCDPPALIAPEPGTTNSQLWFSPVV